jgi:hypothetical protein
MSFDFRKLYGRGFFPARVTNLLSREVMRHGESGKLCAFYAHYGPGRRTFDCENCAARFEGPIEAAKHAAEYGHVAMLRLQQSICAHDIADDPQHWEGMSA